MVVTEQIEPSAESPNWKYGNILENTPPPYRPLFVTIKTRPLLKILFESLRHQII